MTNATPFTLPIKDAFEGEAPKGLIEEGDALLILKANGDVVPMSIGLDVSAVNLEQPTEEDRKILDQGTRLFCLAMAANSTQIMQILKEIASNPDVIDPEMLLREARKRMI